MTTAIIGTLILMSFSTSFQRSETPSLKPGAVYCISKEAIAEHMKATADADSDRVYDILWKQKLCDYTQAAVDVAIVEDRPSEKWLKVKVSATDGVWRKGSKIPLPKDSLVYVRRSEVKR